MTTPHVPGPKASVLVVDDDVDIALGLQDLLAFMGLHVTVEHTGAEAIATAREQTFDVVLMDLMLPDMDGLVVLPALRAIDPTLPVIIITAFADLPKKHGSLTEGAFGHLTKPFDTEELKALVRRAIGVKHLSGEVAEAKQALTASEERFREVVETAPDAIVLADGNGHILSWNAAAVSLFGFTPEEVQGRPLTMLMPERYHQLHLDALQRVRSSGDMRQKGKLVNVHGLRKHGGEFQVEMSLSSWISREQRFLCGILRDVTAREEAAARLRRQQIEQQTLLDLIPAMVWYKDTQNRILRVNGLAAGSIGKTVAEVEGQSTYDLYPEEAEKYYRDDLEVIDSGRPKLGIIERYQTGTGEKRWVQTDKVPYRDKDGTVLGILVFAQDITDRKRTEEALRMSEERLRVVIESAATGMALVTEEGSMVVVNSALARLFGYAQPELKGRPVTMLVPEGLRPREADSRPFFLQPLGGEDDRPLAGLRKDGTSFPLDIRCTSLPAGEAGYAGAFIIQMTPAHKPLARSPVGSDDAL
jgi:PAS domain S-box-containing protein